MVDRFMATQRIEPDGVTFKPMHCESVAATDYDALAAELSQWQNGSAHVNGKLLDRIAALEAALLDLYSGTAEYVYLNHLGDPHNTTPMRNAAKILGAPALEAYDRLARLTAETEVEESNDYFRR